MTLDRTAIVVIAISEIVALWVIFRAWRTPSHMAEKIGITLVALVPVIGPVFGLFLSNHPSPAHPALRDNARYRTDVLDRWRHIMDEKNPVVRQRKWKDLMGSGNDNEG